MYVVTVLLPWTTLSCYVSSSFELLKLNMIKTQLLAFPPKLSSFARSLYLSTSLSILLSRPTVWVSFLFLYHVTCKLVTFLPLGFLGKISGIHSSSLALGLLQHSHLWSSVIRQFP